MIRLLQGEMAQGRVANSYLFLGPRGVGKQTVALAFADLLQEGNHPADRKVIAAESVTRQISIDQVREMNRWLAWTPSQGDWKVGIIDGADSMTEQAAHACLKMVEEPPTRSVLILIAVVANRIPQTLLSRCHRVRFVPQGIQKVASLLEKQEGLEKSMALMLATWSGGRFGLALEFHRKGRLAAKNGMLDQILSAQRQKILEIPLGAAARQDQEEALEWLAAWWRDLAILSVGGDRRWLIHQDRLADLQAAVMASPAGEKPSRFKDNVETWLDRVDRAYQAQEAIQKNASPRIALAAVLCQ